MEFKFDDSSIKKAMEEAATKVLEKTAEKQIQKELFPEYMDLKTGAKYAGVSYATFMKFRRQKMGLKIFEVDGIKRVSKSEIDRFYRENSY